MLRAVSPLSLWELDSLQLEKNQPAPSIFKSVKASAIIRMQATSNHHWSIFNLIVIRYPLIKLATLKQGRSKQPKTTRNTQYGNHTARTHHTNMKHSKGRQPSDLWPWQKIAYYVNFFCCLFFQYHFKGRKRQTFFCLFSVFVLSVFFFHFSVSLGFWLSWAWMPAGDWIVSNGHHVGRGGAIIPMISDHFQSCASSFISFGRIKKKYQWKKWIESKPKEKEKKI